MVEKKFQNKNYNEVPGKTLQQHFKIVQTINVYNFRIHINLLAQMNSVLNSLTHQ